MSSLSPSANVYRPLAQSGLGQICVNNDVDSLHAAIGDQVYSKVNALLTDLIQSNPDSPVEIVSAEARSGYMSQFEVRLPVGGDPATAAKVTFLKIKDAAKAGWLSVLGLGVAIALTGPVGAIVPTAGTMWACYQNLITLQRPRDSVAIDLYFTLQRHLVLAKLEQKEDAHPTTGELRLAMATVDADRFEDALNKLHDLRLIDVVSWGSIREDVMEDENRWNIRI